MVKLSLPGRSELPPVSDEALLCLFRKLGPETIVRLLKYLLLEERVVILGEERNDIVHCCQGLRALLYPFKYDHGGNWYISYIPLRDFAQADWSFPGLIGLDKELLKVVEVQETTTWIVDIDTDQVWRNPNRRIYLPEVSLGSMEDDITPYLPRAATE